MAVRLTAGDVSAEVATAPPTKPSASPARTMSAAKTSRLSAAASAWSSVPASSSPFRIRNDIGIPSQFPSPPPPISPKATCWSFTPVTEPMNPA